MWWVVKANARKVMAIMTWEQSEASSLSGYEGRMTWGKQGQGRDAYHGTNQDIEMRQISILAKKGGRRAICFTPDTAPHDGSSCAIGYMNT